MIVAVIDCLGASWGAGRVLRLDRAQTGALMIASAFGSSTHIGYPVIQYAFPHHPEEPCRGGERTAPAIRIITWASCKTRQCPHFVILSEAKNLVFSGG